MEKRHVFDKPENVTRLLRTLYAICAGLLLIDLVFERYVVHLWESLFGFYALFGFVGCALLVLIAREMRKIVMRDEDFYDR